MTLKAAYCCLTAACAIALIGPLDRHFVAAAILEKPVITVSLECDTICVRLCSNEEAGRKKGRANNFVSHRQSPMN
ncbi:hypothetical protein ACLBX9_29740 [Methylobacterium sp. A49B]